LALTTPWTLFPTSFLYRGAAHSSLCAPPAPLALRLIIYILMHNISMPLFNRFSRLLLVAALLCSWLSNVTAASNPSDFSPANIRRRSGRLERPPPNWGPVRKRDGGKPLVITNLCSETVWPGIGTQAGTGPGTGGFELKAGVSKPLTVGNDWQGRIWGRTNCSFNALGTGASNLNGNNGAGRACHTGDCGGQLSCIMTVRSLPLVNQSILMKYRAKHQLL